MRRSAQYILGPDGREKLVVLTEEEFKLLTRQATMNIAAINRRSDFTLPADVSQLIDAGGNPVAILRKWRGFTARQLAQMVGITPSMLCQIEKSGRLGSTKTIRLLAEQLQVPLDYLFHHPTLR